ncbi:PucR family transcriptional regulator [Nonomuraea aurantiaca]|uniref:PucR family transcriptional regulator n=1 Tax=Nonomuraea aurantiaca TaxID=2878562 RepID=UPI001CD9D287|nr:PucR family transcriptional regulator [Nonomuraea aurantiaca]MCA2222966.1 helix-turn-helix domain-containing protein [Nonomuraea aurantiaca]
MRLADLVARDDLSLVPVTGHDGLGREVRRAYPTDLPDPRRYLRPGDLVLTSGVWYTQPSDCETFADALWTSDAAGLIVGLVVLGELPEALVKACERRRLPLLLAAPDQPFGAITEVVIEEAFAAERRRDERARAQTLLDLLGTQRIAPGEVSAHLRLLGADPGLPTTAMVVARMGGSDDDDVPALMYALARRGRQLVVGGRSDEGIVLVNGKVSRQALTDELRALVTDRPGMRVAAGISDATASVSQLGEALETARRGMESARYGEGPVSVMSVADVDSHELLLAQLPVSVRRSFREHLLGPIIEYDARHGSELLRTLDVFLETCGSWQRTADELYVHVNTLRYRMQRIEELTGRRMSSMRDRTDLYLALRSAQPSEGDPA